MIIKKFQAETETEAIVLAKEELGKEAIVMNIKKIKPKGIYKLFKRTLVEITAAVDDNVSYEKEQVLSKIREIHAAPVTAVMEEQENNTAIEQRLNSLQTLLEAQLKNKIQEKTEGLENSEKTQKEEEEPKDDRIPGLQLIYNQLVGNEVDELYAKQIVNEIERALSKDALVDNILASIYQKLVLKLGQSKAVEIEEGRTKFIFFMGPTGVGKTTTIAKVASSLKLEKKAKVALITADTYRIAAVEQLKTYASILGLPLKVVYSAEEMRDIKSELEVFDVVLIDTAGRSHKSQEQREDIREFLDTVPSEEREVYLVLSVTTKYKDLVRIAETYKEMVDYRLIFTKLDETSSIGSIYNIKMLTGAPLSYVTWGQNVPDDIGKIDAQSIAKQLLGGRESK